MITTFSETGFEAQRHAMVASQLRPNAVSDQRVVLAMATIPREEFLPGSVRELAYFDRLIPLGGGRYANAPMATARLLTQAELEPVDRVLLIGAAGGYTAAVLSTIVAEVVAVEVSPPLLAIARQALRTAGNVELVEGALQDGWAQRAPYDVLVVDGLVEQLPDDLVAQVRNGGRVVSGLMDGGVARLAAGRRTAGFSFQPFADAESAPLPGFALPSRFRF